MKRLLILIIGAVLLSGCQSVNTALQTGLDGLKAVNCGLGVKASCTQQDTVQPSESVSAEPTQTTYREPRHYSSTAARTSSRSNHTRKTQATAAATPKKATTDATTAQTTTSTAAAATTTTTSNAPAAAKPVDLSKQLNALQ